MPLQQAMKICLMRLATKRKRQDKRKTYTHKMNHSKHEKMNKFLNISVLLLSLSMLACGSSDDDKPTPTPTPDKEKVELETVKYTPSKENFFNPERGMYVMVESNMATPLSESRLKTAKSEQESLVQIVYYLKDRRNQALTTADLAKIDNDLATVRKVGMKAILRFAYTSSKDEADAPMVTIKQHLDQLKPLLTKDKDVIACVQAGFIGAWGEWYYSSNGLNNNASRNEVLAKWLEVLPTDRFVQVRTPAYKRNFTGIQTPLDASTAYKNSPQARIAHHNDAFMADETNMGTYEDVAKDKAYLAQEGLYTPIGGETARPSSTTPPSRGKAALDELKTLHWSFLHDGYDRVVLKQWEKDGVMDEIRMNLGYRLVLMRGKYSTKLTPGSDLNAILSIYNIGFAAMYNPRKVQLILRSKDATYIATLPDDPRTWKPRHLTNLTAKVQLPADIPAGDYQLLLFLPDAEPSIAARADYAVRLANKEMWEPTTGYNNLGVSIKVEKTGTASQSTAAVKFIKQ